MKRNSLYLLMLLLFIILVIKNHWWCVASESQETIKPRPSPIIKIVPKLESNFVFDDFIKAVNLAKIYNRKIIVIFSAEWCPYCVVLKKDASKIPQFDKYIIVFLDTDNKEANQHTINLYHPKSLPTSIVVDINTKEISRKIGYKNKDYTKWLDTLQH